MTRLKIDGMTCGHCVMHVKNALSAVPGVTGAQVDLAQGEARVEGAADPRALVAAVEEEGYRAQVVD